MLVLEPIFEAFERHFSGSPATTEHAIITELQGLGIEPFNAFNLSQSKDLFRAHFLTKHALYKLQNRYAESSDYSLEISLTKIIRHPVTSQQNNSLDTLDETRAYYLDIKHYFETEEDEINDMLSSFWQKYLAADDKSSALETLDLEPSADYKAVKRRYRELAQRHHPDKGGCEKRFKELVGAKKILDLYFQRK